jgi:hypothetical protein
MKRPLTPWCKEVKKALIDKDLNVTELSDLVGANCPYVSGVVNGRMVLPDLAEKIAKQLDIKVPYL